jgi:hypothetical protein
MKHLRSMNGPTREHQSRLARAEGPAPPHTPHADLRVLTRTASRAHTPGMSPKDPRSGQTGKFMEDTGQ